MVRESWSTEDEREEKPPEIGWSTQRAASTGVSIRIFICLCVLVSIYVRMCERGDVTYLVAWSIPRSPVVEIGQVRTGESHESRHRRGNQISFRIIVFPCFGVT